MALDIHTTPEKIAELVTQGIAVNLEKRIREELQKHVDPIISELARNLADQIAVNVQAYYNLDPLDQGVKVHLSFNSKDVQYVAKR